MQIFLQILIIATGNYNFFNLLTIALCFPCMIGEDNNIVKRRSKDTINGLWHHLSTMQTAICVIFLSIACKEMFELEQYVTEGGKQKMVWLKLSMNRYDCNNLVEKTLPVVILFTLLCTLVSGLRLVGKNVTNITGLSSLAHTLVCLTCIVITAMPLFDLAPGMHQLGFVKQSTLRTIRRKSSVVSHGYGLFRRMTGVGKVSSGSTLGLPPSIVARPEIVLEAIIVDDENFSGNSTSENDWQELNFRFKPGAIDRRPRQVAPHQPRFEWRMWFAALGSVQHNAWLLSFVDKILAGCPSVLNLLDEHDLIAKKKRIQMVRAQLYEYDFTRLDTKWARRIPDVHILGADDSDIWWKRKAVGQYLPALDSDNESLKAFLQHAGYSPCRAEDERCNGIGPSCQLAYFIRRTCSANPLLFSGIAICLCVIVDVSRSLRVFTRRSSKMKRD
jgi:hypothetical protein